VAYFCGHEHNIQVQKVEGVWHVVSGGLTRHLYPLNGAPDDGLRNRLLYGGYLQNPRASLIWPWNDGKRSYWGWCLVVVGEREIKMTVFGTSNEGEMLRGRFKKLKSFVLWRKGNEGP
jgi:hypothetical protein